MASILEPNISNPQSENQDLESKLLVTYSDFLVTIIFLSYTFLLISSKTMFIL